jgi:FMN phosphatase YigB (HAD superfamily)
MTAMRIRRLLRAADLPALAAFARGYLHEDLLVEHGSATNAAAAFARDASPDERRQLVDDLEQLLRAFEGRHASRVAKFFSDELRAAWTPASLDDVQALLAFLRHRQLDAPDA